MQNEALIRRTEEISMNALPALQTVYYDGWVLRFADGYTRRANSINPLYSSSIDLDVKIDRCEDIYRAKKRQIVFKLTDAAVPDELEENLTNRGYVPGDASPVSIQMLDLERPLESAGMEVIRSETWSEEWLEEFAKLNLVSENDARSLKRMLTSMIPQCCYFSAVSDGLIVGCGLAVFENRHIGLFDIVTDSRYRRQGIGKALTLDMLQWGKSKGALRSYLQVVHDNEPAISLYANLGFREAYKYWYLVRDI
jgi:ribosomal protein S18 acetylase RimI-like enzyme